MLKFIFVLHLFLLNGCATRETPLLDDTDIIESISTDDDRLDRFRVSREDVEPTPTDLTQKTEPPVTSEAATSKKPVKKTPPKVEKKTPIPEPTKPVSTENLPKEFLDESPEDSSDYPEIFHSYDELSRKVWAQAKPVYFPGEEKVFIVRYLGLNAGQVRMLTKPLAKINDRPVMHFQASMKSARYYEYIYRLDDSIETYMDAETLVPVRYTMIQRESGQDVDDLQLFDSAERKTFLFYKRVKNKQTKEEEKTAFTPELFQDSFSALAFARGLPYKIGDIYEYPIITRTRLWLLKMEVEKIEEISVMKKKVQAYRVRAETRFPGVLEKRGDILFWFSADDKKKLLRFRANVKIGSIEGELTEYKAGEALKPASSDGP